jgi:tyrosyl-tRNA synthetase
MGLEVVKRNIHKITMQLSKLFVSIEKYATARGFSDMGKVEILNNEAWWTKMNLHTFLDSIARNMRVSAMLARER